MIFTCIYNNIWYNVLRFKKDWRENIDINSEKYQKYLERRKKSMVKTHREKLEQKNKQTPEEYKNRKKQNGKTK